MSAGLRVLVAEDVPALRRLWQRVLEGLGHDVAFAVTGREAVDRALDGDFDVVLMDFHLPELSGIEASREIVARSDGDHPRIVGLTGSVAEDEHHLGIEAGMATVLSKPPDIAELAACLQ